MRGGLTVSLILALLLPLPSSGGHRPGGDRMTAVYDLYLGGLWGGELTVAAEFDAADYRGGAHLQTAGLVGFFYEAGFKAEAEGRAGPGGLTPERFVSQSYDASHSRRVEIAYAAGRPVAMTAEPAYDERSWAIEPQAQAGALDPVSAALAALTPAPAEAACDRRIDIFDGERRFAIELGEPRRKGAGLRCTAAYVRVAGFKPKLMKKWTRWEFEIELGAGPDGLYRVTRAAGATFLGDMVALLRQ